MRGFSLAVLSCVVAAACTPTGTTEPTESTDAGLAVPELTQPPVRQTPFCQRMIELDDELPDDPAVDTRDQVLEAYRAALPDVPAEIEAEFRAVITALETGSPATIAGGATDDPVDVSDEVGDDLSDPADTLPLDATVPPRPTGPTTLPSEEQLVAEEGRLPDDQPAARVNDYIDFECRGTTNNPGPPATEPGVGIPTSDAG